MPVGTAEFGRLSSSATGMASCSGEAGFGYFLLGTLDGVACSPAFPLPYGFGLFMDDSL